MTKRLGAKSVDEQSQDSQKKLITGMSEILYVLKVEMEKVDMTIENIRNNPKPDVEYMTMPERLKAYRDGLKFAFKIIHKYKQIEGVMDNGK
jgi:hypothetical protein